MNSEFTNLRDHFQASYNNGFDLEKLRHFVRTYLNSVEPGAGEPLPVKYHCNECECEIDESLLLGYDDPTIGLCEKCRRELTAFWMNEDGLES